jgi:predicted MFS family arabinose efflux permease
VLRHALEGRRELGQVSAANTAALVAGSAILWVLYRFVKISFTVAFTIGAVAFLISAALLLIMNPTQTVKLSQRFVFRKEYRLYYWLSLLFGARKQIFLTFAPWVLVDVFKQKVTTMTILFFIIASVSIFFRPFTGYLIDRLGEKIVLGGEAVLVFFICMGYSFAADIAPANIAVIIIAACYIIDNSMSAVEMARSTYVKKIAVHPDDVTPTLSAGTSFDHVVAMTIPFLGGLLWASVGYQYVFIVAAVIALMNLFMSLKIKID